MYVSGNLKRPSSNLETVEAYTNFVNSSFKDINSLGFMSCCKSFMHSVNKLGWDWLEFQIKNNGYAIEYVVGKEADTDLANLVVNRRIAPVNQTFAELQCTDPMNSIFRELYWVSRATSAENGNETDYNVAMRSEPLSSGSSVDLVQQFVLQVE